MNEEIKLSKSEIIGICEFLKMHHFENSYLLLDYITNLQEYKSRNEKAIEHIKEHQLIYTSQYEEESNFDNHLLDILNGGDEEC